MLTQGWPQPRCYQVNAGLEELLLRFTWTESMPYASGIGAIIITLSKNTSRQREPGKMVKTGGRPCQIGSVDIGDSADAIQPHANAVAQSYKAHIRVAAHCQTDTALGVGKVHHGSWLDQRMRWLLQ